MEYQDVRGKSKEEVKEAWKDAASKQAKKTMERYKVAEGLVRCSKCEKIFSMIFIRFALFVWRTKRPDGKGSRMIFGGCMVCIDCYENIAERAKQDKTLKIILYQIAEIFDN